MTIYAWISSLIHRLPKAYIHIKLQHNDIKAINFDLRDNSCVAMADNVMYCLYNAMNVLSWLVVACNML